jgi:hypothetical protein
MYGSGPPNFLIPNDPSVDFSQPAAETLRVDEASLSGDLQEGGTEGRTPDGRFPEHSGCTIGGLDELSCCFSAIEADNVEPCGHDLVQDGQLGIGLAGFLHRPDGIGFS